MDIKDFWNDSSPKKNNINESVNDIEQISSDDDDDSSIFEKIGYILIQYEDILNKDNLNFMIELYTRQDNKELSLYLFKKITYIIKKYKDDVTEEIINCIITNIHTSLYNSIYTKFSTQEPGLPTLVPASRMYISNYTNFKNILNNFLQYSNKIIDEYLDVRNEDSIIIYINNITKCIDFTQK